MLINLQFLVWVNESHLENPYVRSEDVQSFDKIYIMRADNIINLDKISLDAIVFDNLNLKI